MFQRFWRLAKALGQLFIKPGRIEPETAPDSDFLFSPEIQRTPDPISPEAQAWYDQKAGPFTCFRSGIQSFKAATRGYNAFTRLRDSKDDGDPLDYG